MKFKEAIAAPGALFFVLAFCATQQNLNAQERGLAQPAPAWELAQNAAPPPSPARGHGNAGSVTVDVPTTKVEVQPGTRDTKVKVRAPRSSVDVDTKRRRVRIRVPYFNRDIRW